MESILTSVKKMLGIAEQYNHFDDDIIMHINSVFMTLTQIGVGPSRGFYIEDDVAEWTDFISNPAKLQAVKTYMFLKVKLIFDPGSIGSSTLASYERQIQELEWRLNTMAESSDDYMPDDDIPTYDEVIATLGIARLGTMRLGYDGENQVAPAASGADYAKQNFKDGQTLFAAMLNRMEAGIVQNETNIKNIELTPGPQGEPGEPGQPGQDGYTPVKGVDYFDGKDGYTPVKGVDYFDGEPGPRGEKGDPGEPGKDGENNVYVGSEPPTSDTVLVWIDPDYDENTEFIQSPMTASVGQTIVVKAVDENGKPTEWEAVDFPSSAHSVINMTETVATIMPNALYKWGEVERLEITLEDGNPVVVNEYTFEFASGSTATELTLPETVKWVNEPTIEPNKTYQVSILNGIGVIVGA